MNPTSPATNRLHDLIARQRSSRVRDAAFAILLAVGIGLSLGAIRTAADHANPPLADAPACHVAQSC